MQDYILACLAGMWFADGITLLVAPRFVMDRIREGVMHHSSTVFRWGVLAVPAGLALLAMGTDLRYGSLWMITGLGMIAKGLLVWRGPAQLRKKVMDWCLSREDIDYRFWGLGLCMLAVLLLHALGWIGHTPLS
jgi:hypothetical protein